MEAGHRPRGLFSRFRAKYEKLLGRSPRTLQIACALALAAIAFELIAEVVFAEWFYHTYRRDYAYTLEWRMSEWAYGLCVTLLAIWMLGIAWTLLRGTSRRADRGLLSPPALRAWGIAFALLPITIVAAGGHGIAHLEFVFWSWIASGACFALAARRSRLEEAGEDPGARPYPGT